VPTLLHSANPTRRHHPDPDEVCRRRGNQTTRHKVTTTIKRSNKAAPVAPYPGHMPARDTAADTVVVARSPCCMAKARFRAVA
jgi:hypothetical protein